MPIRVRLTLLFTLATIVLLAGGGWIYLRQLTNGLLSSLDSSLRTRASTLQVEVRANDVGSLQQLASSPLLSPFDEVGQVLRADGTVFVGSPGFGSTKLLSARQRAAAASGAMTFDTTLSGVRAGGSSRASDSPATVERLRGPSAAANCSSSPQTVKSSTTPSTRQSGSYCSSEP